ncbi:MAG: RNA polymerase sigma-70 factor [Saprospiraceae bacterium]
MDVIEQKYLVNLVNGDKQSLWYFYEKYHAKIYRYTFTLIRNKEAAEEITSDVFVRIWKKRAVLNVEKGVDHLMFKITKDFCRDYLRKVARDTALREAYICQCLTSNNKTVEEDLTFKENLQIATQAIEKLPPKCRQVFRLRYDQEMSLLQIANELGITTSTVQKHLHKANKLVRNYLKMHSDLVFFLLLQLSFFSI